MDQRAHAKLMTTRVKTFPRRSSNSRRNAAGFGFTPSDLRQLRALKTPAGVQKFLDELPYNLSYTGCRYREPVYRSLRELAMSYFNIYFNLRVERTLRRYSRPVNLARFDHLNWMTTDKPIWFIAEYLCDIPHVSLLTPALEKNLTRLDRRTMSGEMVGHRTR